MSDFGPIFTRLRSHWRAKLGHATIVGLLFCAGYFTLQRHPLRAPVVFEESLVDRWIGFSPGWVWVYQSLYLIFPLSWLISTRREWFRFAAGFLLVMAVGFACFMIYPVICPRPVLTEPHGMYAWLVSYDTPVDCFPSLHLALATYTACAVIAGTDGLLRRTFLWIFPVWIGLIAYATLATKQHYFVDLLPGVALGSLAHRLTWNWARPKPGGAYALMKGPVV